MPKRTSVKGLLGSAVEYASAGGLIVAAYNQFIGPGYTWDQIKNYLINIPTTFKSSWQSYVYGALVLLIGLGLINSYKAKKDIPMALKALGLFLVAMYGSAYIFGGIKGVPFGTASSTTSTSTSTSSLAACQWSGQPYQTYLGAGGQYYKTWQQNGKTCTQNISTGQLVGMN